MEGNAATRQAPLLRALKEAFVLQKQTLEGSSRNLKQLQQQLLAAAGQLKESKFREHIRLLVVSIVQNLDELQEEIWTQLAHCENLITKEAVQGLSDIWNGQQPHVGKNLPHTPESEADDELLEGEAPLLFFDAEEFDSSEAEPACEVGVSEYTRRSCLPSAKTEMKVSLWAVLRNCVGKDLSKITMPVSFNEPTSFLQRLAENFQYVDLLRYAAGESRSVNRLLWVSIYSITPFESTVGRVYKPFNPLLGETYEFSHRGFKFLAEQVSHHPPATAYHAVGGDFEAWGNLTVNNRFTGKSVAVSMVGPLHLRLQRSADRFTWKRPRIVIRNVILGNFSMELAETIRVQNHSTGDYALIEYVPAGWLGSDSHHVKATVFDSNNTPTWRIGGRWSEEIWVQPLVDGAQTDTPLVNDRSALAGTPS